MYNASVKDKDKAAKLLRTLPVSRTAHIALHTLMIAMEDEISRRKSNQSLDRKAATPESNSAEENKEKNDIGLEVISNLEITTVALNVERFKKLRTAGIVATDRKVEGAVVLSVFVVVEIEAVAASFTMTIISTVRSVSMLFAKFADGAVTSSMQ